MTIYMYTRTLLSLSIFLLILTACRPSRAQSQNEAAVIKEVFHTQRDEGDNVDSPAVWHGGDGEHWLLATAKESDELIVFDADDGSIVRRVGSEGTDEGQFQRPNGIAVIDDLALIVERDNKRIQVMQLPEFTPLGFMQHEDIRKPYGLTVDKLEDNSYTLYMTDNFNPYLEGYPAQGELDERIHQFRFSVQDDTLQSNHVRVFGDIRGEGVLHKVESLFLDRSNNRLLIADEAYNKRNIKVYDLSGNFAGEVISSTYFTSEPEGIALYSCDDGSGYWIITDQHESAQNKFQVFERLTLKHIGTFKGERTRNTDGIWLTQKGFGQFEQGAFYPVHDDGSVTAIRWSDIAEALNLRLDCTDE